MPSFSARSLGRLDSCDSRLQNVLRAVIRHVDCTILEGERSLERQSFLFEAGKSKLRAGQSMHNRSPSLAFDALPYPIDWSDRERMTLFAGYVLGIARAMGVELRWGGDWDRDWKVRDNVFDDLAHFELVDRSG